MNPLDYLCTYTTTVLRLVAEVGAPEGWRINVHHDSTVYVSTIPGGDLPDRSVGLRMFYVTDKPLWRWHDHMRPESILRAHAWESFAEALGAVLPALLAMPDAPVASSAAAG